MSDPATNPQIEDVLSSIRRLVAEEIGQTPLKSRKAAPEEADKLVLSPTQKIRVEAAESGADLWDDTAEMTPAKPEAQWWMRSDSDPVTPRETVEGAAAPEVLPLGEVAVETAKVSEPESLAEPETAPGRLKGALAELEAALSRQDIDFEPPEGEDASNGGLEMTAMPWSDEPLTFAEDEDEEEPAAPDTSAAEEDAPFSFDPHERLFDRAAAEATFRHHPVEDAPVNEWAEDDAAMAESRIEDEPAFAETDYEDAVPGLTGEIDPADLIDEQALRDLVADIVRQELQGALGERITRNVRKLVRREIHRALMGLDQNG